MKQNQRLYMDKENNDRKVLLVESYGLFVFSKHFINVNTSSLHLSYYYDR